MVPCSDLVCMHWCWAGGEVSSLSDFKSCNFRMVMETFIRERGEQVSFPSSHRQQILGCICTKSCNYFLEYLHHKINYVPNQIQECLFVSLVPIDFCRRWEVSQGKE